MSLEVNRCVLETRATLIASLRARLKNGGSTQSAEELLKQARSLTHAIHAARGVADAIL